MGTTYERTYYFDYLRIAATIAVIFLHVAAGGINSCSIGSFNWNVLNIYDSFTRWSVPIFVMISGSLFLNKEFTIKEMFFKYGLRIITAFCFWSIVYVGYFIVTSDKKSTLTQLLARFITGEYHMWFCFLIVGLYITVPLIKKITEDSSLLKYFLILSFLFSIMVPFMLEIIKPISADIYNACKTAVGHANISFVCGYILYFVLGYYIYITDFNKYIRWIIYFLGVLGFIATAYYTYRDSVSTGNLVLYYNNLSINVFLEAVAVFTFAKYNINVAFKRESVNKLVRLISKYSFGVYLIHIIILDILRKDGFWSLTLNPVISVPIVSLSILMISLIISAVINNIPIIKKYIV